MDLLAYIMSIDITVNSINSIRDILIPHEPKILHGSNNIFTKKIMSHLDDNNFFKEIRAAFGVHSTDLRQELSEGEKINNYASFSSPDLFHKNKVGLNLYNENDLGTWGKKFEIDLLELETYIKIHIDNLECLLIESQRQTDCFINKMKKKKINIPPDTKTKLKVLEDEINKRFSTDYLLEDLKKIENILNFDASNSNNDELVINYKKAVELQIDSLFYHLQKMSFFGSDSELAYKQLDEVIRPDQKFNTLENPHMHYYLSQLHEDKPLLGLTEIQRLLEEYVVLDPYIEREEICILVDAAFFAKNNE